jgi:hypothetical protein
MRMSGWLLGVPVLLFLSILTNHTGLRGVANQLTLFPQAS